MMVATITFTGPAVPGDTPETNCLALQADIIRILCGVFCSYSEAASAQREYRRVVQVLAAEDPFLFAGDEARRAALAAHPAAQLWDSFQAQATEALAGVGFSIRFTGA